MPRARKRVEEAAYVDPHRAAGGVPDEVLLFSNGEITRAQAMRRLGIGYSALLDLIAERQLPLPRVEPAEAEQMAAALVAVMDSTAG